MSDTPHAIAIVNARIRTGDARRPWADGLLAADGRLALVGSSAEVRKAALRGTRVVDARGRLVVAGADGTDGVLRRGMPADFVMVDGEDSRTEPAAVRDAQVLLTVVRGVVVFER